MVAQICFTALVRTRSAVQRAIDAARVFARLAVLILGAVSVGTFGLAGIANAFDANDGYAPSADNVVQAVVVQPDGKAIVAGSFTTINGQVCASLCRLQVDGSVDTSFVSPTVDSFIHGMALQPDGKVLVGGQFTMVAGQARHYLARLNADGSLDTGFADPNVSHYVYAIALQPDGKLLIGGFFATIAGQPHNDLARLNVDGSLDTSFADTVDAVSGVSVGALVVQPDGKVLIGGTFTSIAGQPRHSLARLNADGTPDAGFPDLNISYPGQSIVPIVEALVLQPDGKLLVGGEFTSIGGQTCNQLARVNADGSVDPGFAYPNTQTAYIDTVVLQADGKVLVGGNTGNTIVNQGLLERLDTDGSVASSVVIGPAGSIGGVVMALALQPDGKAVAGGSFSSFDGQTRSNLARLNVGGAVDTTLLDQAPGNQINAVAVQPDDTLLVGGYFTTIGGVTRNRLARLDSAGVVDSSFPDPQINAAVDAITVQSDRKLLIGGAFTLIAGNKVAYIARLNANGSIDTSFQYAGADKNVDAIALQADGKKLVIGGDFTTIQLQPRGHLARLNAIDGSLDTGFADVKADNTIDAVALQPDGKVLIGGSFTMIANQPRHGLARLNSDGTLDTNFPDLNISYPGQSIAATVVALVLQPDGKLLVGGEFTSIGGQACHDLARVNADGSVDTGFVYPDAQTVYVDTLALQADGRVVIGGHTGDMFINQGLLERLNNDGSVESVVTVNPVSSIGGYIAGIALQADGKVVAGGYFTGAGGQTRTNLARLSTTEAALQSLTTSALGTTVTWTRAGASPELSSAPMLQISSDNLTFSNLGFMTSIPGGWQRTNVSPPLDQLYYLRGQGQTVSGEYAGSQGLIESTRQAYVRNKLFANGFE